MYPLRITLVPGVPYEYAGQFGYMRVLEAGADIKVRTDTNINTVLRAGLGGDMSRPIFQRDERGQETQVVIGRQFANRATLETDVVQYVEVMISAFETTDQTVAGSVEVKPASAAQPLAQVTAATGGKSIAANVNRSELVLVADADNAGPFWIGGTVGQGVPLVPGASFTLPVTGVVQVIAENAGDKLYSLETV